MFKIQITSLGTCVYKLGKQFIKIYITVIEDMV